MYDPNKQFAITWQQINDLSGLLAELALLPSEREDCYTAALHDRHGQTILMSVLHAAEPPTTSPAPAGRTTCEICGGDLPDSHRPECPDA